MAFRCPVIWQKEREWTWVRRVHTLGNEWLELGAFVLTLRMGKTYWLALCMDVGGGLGVEH